jgi:P-type conjugative transfer protein TrbJ
LNARHDNKPRFTALAFGLSLVLATQVSAGGGGGLGGGATEPTQILNNIELGIISAQEVQAVAQRVTQIANQAIQIANQIQQIQNMVQNTLNIPNQVWGQIQQEIAPLMQVVQQGQAIAYTMANVGQQFQARFPDYNNWMGANFGAQNFMQSYRGWYTTQRDAISGALQVANLQAGQFQNENQVMAQLNAMGNNAQGRMQALQVGAQIANQQVQQMQKLRQLVMSQMNMQANYMAAEASKDAAKQARAERFWDTNRGTQIGDGQRYGRP